MDPELYLAATSGDVSLLEQVANANMQLLLSKAPHENTALHIAAMFGHADFTRKILQLCSQLLSMKNSDGDTALHCATRAGCLKIVEILVDFELTMAGVEGRSVELLRMQNKEEDTALHEALRKLRENMAFKMLAADPKLAPVVNKAKESSFLLAVKVELVEVVKGILLGDRSANSGDIQAAAIHNSSGTVSTAWSELTIEEKRELIKIQENTGRTALHYAAWQNNADLIDTILKIDSLHVPYIADNNGHSPLHVAAAFGMQCSMLELLKRCPDTIEQQDTSGRNVLHIACLNQSYEIIQQLLKLPHIGGLLNRPDEEGNTPVHLASRDKKLALLLRNMRAELATNKDRQTELELGSVLRDQPRHMPDVILIKDLHPRKEFDLKLIDAFKDQHQVFVLVASLIATVTFTTAFTLPGGFRSSNENNPGTAILASKRAFGVFVLLDTLSMCISIFAIFCYIFAWGARALKKNTLILKLLSLGNIFTLIACICMLFTFSVGLFVAIAPERMVLAIEVLAICSLLPIFLISYVSFSIVRLLWYQLKCPRARKPVERIV